MFWRRQTVPPRCIVRLWQAGDGRALSNGLPV